MLVTVAWSFVVWTFTLYWVHRLAHVTPLVSKIHNDHHKFIAENTPPFWHWSNLFLFNDTWLSTVDLWITEVIPTFLLSWMLGWWWLIVFYYFWAAFIQENIEHNPKFDYFPWLPSGAWHLLHHKNSKINFGSFTIIWDYLFRTKSDCFRTQ